MSPAIGNATGPVAAYSQSARSRSVELSWVELCRYRRGLRVHELLDNASAPEWLQAQVMLLALEKRKGYRTMKTVWSCVHLSWLSAGVRETDGRTRRSWLGVRPVDSNKLPSAFCPWRTSTSSEVPEWRWRWSRRCNPAELMLFVFDSVHVSLHDDREQ